MKRIAIITPGGLPVPTVKGGAVENLIQFWIEKNEEKQLAELTVFSCYDEKAVIEAEKFKNTEFVFIKKNAISEKISGYLNRALRKYFKKIRFRFYPFLSKTIKEINKSNYDYILIENRAEYVLKTHDKCDSKILFHLHNDILNNKVLHCSPIAKSCNKILTVSDYIKNRVLTIDKNLNNVFTLKNVVNTSAFQLIDKDDKIKARKDYIINEDDVVFVFAGRLVPEKGIKELIEAFAEVHKKHINTKLMIVGAGWFGGNIQNPFIDSLKFSASNIEDAIIFTGYIDYSKMPYIYNCADINVIPSIWDDPAPLTVFEAMASGNPLIVSDSGGIPEYVNSDCAITVKRGENFIDDLADAMEKLICDENLRISMGEAGRKQAMKFDKKDYLKNLLKIIEE